MEILDVIVAFVLLVRWIGRTVLQGLRNSWTRFAARQWLSTEAVVQAITVEDSPGGLRIDYEYEVNGAFHAGTRRVACFTKTGAAEFAGRLKCRATYVIYHDPQRPWRSWLPDDARLVRDAEDCSAYPEQFVSILESSATSMNGFGSGGRGGNDEC